MGAWENCELCKWAFMCFFLWLCEPWVFMYLFKMLLQALILLPTMNCLGFICCQYGGREICSCCSSWMYIIMSWTFSVCPAKEMMIAMSQMQMPLMDTWQLELGNSYRFRISWSGLITFQIFNCNCSCW